MPQSNQLDKIEFNSALTKAVVYEWINRNFGKTKNKEILRVMKTLVDLSVHTIENCCESEIEKKLAYSLYTHLRLLGAYAAVMPYKALRFIEEPDNEDYKVFATIFDDLQIGIFPNAWVDKKTRVDFMITIKPIRKRKRQLLIIECDSFQWHSSSQQITKEKQRERRIKKKLDGIDILRFSGSEIYNKPSTVAQEISSYIYDKHYGKV